MSPLSQGRGSKRRARPCLPPFGLVAPLAGAWIETRNAHPYAISCVRRASRISCWDAALDAVFGQDRLDLVGTCGNWDEQQSGGAGAEVMGRHFILGIFPTAQTGP